MNVVASWIPHLEFVFDRDSDTAAADLELEHLRRQVGSHQTVLDDLVQPLEPARMFVRGRADEIHTGEKVKQCTVSLAVTDKSAVSVKFPYRLELQLSPKIHYRYRTGTIRMRINTSIYHDQPLLTTGIYII